MVLFAIVLECTVIEVLDDNITPSIVFEANVTFAPSATETYPPFSIISVAVPPTSMSIRPPELTVVLFATPPLEMNIRPPELTMVLFAVVLECTVIEV